MADDIDGKFDKEPRVYSAGELTDLSGLPGEFRAFRAEMRTAFEMLTVKLLPIVDRQGVEIADLRERVATLEAEVLNASGRRRAKR